MTLNPGPYFEVPVGGGTTAPFYALRFDGDGRSEGPLTQEHLIGELRRDDFTDVYLFSHGWNNDWQTALDRYRAFIREYQTLREAYGLRFDRTYRPLLAGVFWPATTLVTPWEQGPEFAGSGDDGHVDAADVSLVADFAEEVAPSDLERFYQLAESESLEEDEARELLGMVSAVFADGDPDIAADPPRDVDELLIAWAKLEAAVAAAETPASPDDFGAVGTGTATAPEAAGFLNKLNPRNLFRGFTVWKMKDRAGVVGANGVGPALREMLEATAAKGTRFHLIGHSYGARVLLNAVGRPSGAPLPRSVKSMLLLQPAVNHLCFADQLPNGKPGGYQDVPAKVDQPILSTFSAHDFPLSKTFHLALRRGKDLGDVEIAAGEPPSEYAALGGYGPRGFAGWREVAIKDPADDYQLRNGAPEVWAVNGTRTISGHGDVVNPSTAWALFDLARG
jgi:hypothetical protein